MAKLDQQPVVLLLGATGLFGELLAKRLLRQERVDLVCAGRNAETLSAFCGEFGGRYIQFDRDNSSAVDAAINQLQPFAVIDCAGPYQAYGDDPYKFARTANEAGCHYFDIADASDFVKGFSGLDELARSKNVVALSGASTTPAISSSVADALTSEMTEVENVTTVIIPGNRAKRSLSVMQSILSQVGQPMRITRHGESEEIKGWSETESFDLHVEGKPNVSGRLAAFVNTPDIAFFTERYAAKNVVFKAGLEVKLFHYDLAFGGWLVSIGFLKSLEPFSKFSRWVASWFEWMGTDQGGMKVAVLGKNQQGVYQRLEWDLIADDGHGPNIPTLPISIILNRVLEGEYEAGARPCLGEISLTELDEAFAEFGGKSQINRYDAKTVFHQALGAEFDKLPQAVRDLHNNFGKAEYKGIASIKGPTGLLGMIASKLVGFPSSANDIPVNVTITADDKSETWVREFADKSFKSHLSVDEKGYAQERFGILSARLGLKLEDEKLLYPVLSGRLFGWIPFPAFLMPQSISHESIDDEGRFVFDVLVKFRFGGRIAHYQGWLERQD